MKIIGLGPAFLLCFLFCSWRSEAATQSPYFQAVIATPTIVNMAQTRAIPFSLCVDFRTVNETSLPPLPSRVKLWNSAGSFVVDSSLHPEINGYTAIIDTPRTPTSLTLTIEPQGYLTTQEQIKIEVTTAGVDATLLGTTTIELRRAAKVAFTRVTQRIAADGKTTGLIALLISDEKGQPVANLPLMLKGRTPTSDTRTIIAATTSPEGKIEFVLPALARPGYAVFQISDGLLLTTRQFEIHYEDENFRDQPFQTENPLWWQKPLVLFESKVTKN